MAKRSEDDYELYLYTIDVYIRLVGALPLDKSLAQFGVQNFSEIGNLDIDDRDFAARICFSRGCSNPLSRISIPAKR